MKVVNYKKPKTSFLSIDKDLDSFINRIYVNKRLQKYLFHTVKNPLAQADLTDEQLIELFGKNIKIVPKLYVDGTVLNYIVISFDNFTPNMNNPEFRDCVVSFDIICHYDQWQLNDNQLRPYKIAAELDSMFNNEKFSGIGELHFIGAKQLLLSDEFGGISLMYEAIHGEDDKVNMLNPSDQEDFEIDFKEMQQLLKG